MKRGNEMLYKAYWRNDIDRKRHHGFVKACDPENAFDIVTKNLQAGSYVVAIYKASENEITPQSLCINFENTTQYKLF